jgi:hypothetical protein
LFFQYPNELRRFIVEQQYAKAVVIVLKTRAYVNTISQELNLAINKTATVNKNYRNAAAASQAAEIAAAAAQAQTQALVEVLNRIDELCVHLAATIRKSVLNLPTSLVRVSSPMYISFLHIFALFGREDDCLLYCSGIVATDLMHARWTINP